MRNKITLTFPKKYDGRHLLVEFPSLLEDGNFTFVKAVPGLQGGGYAKLHFQAFHVLTTVEELLIA